METKVLLSNKELAFLLKTQKHNHSSASGWWEYAKSYFKENIRTFCKTPTTQENM